MGTSFPCGMLISLDISGDILKSALATGSAFGGLENSNFVIKF